MPVISLSEFHRHLSRLIRRVADRSEHLILSRSGRPVAEVRPVPEGRSLQQAFELLNRLPKFNEEEAQDFARDIEQGRRSLGEDQIRDVWDS